MNLPDLRRDTPGCLERIHLNNAGSSLMPEPVRKAVVGHLDLEARIGGYEAAAEREGAIGEAYEAVARLVGALPRNIAFTENATVSFAQALSAVPFEAGDVVITTRNDYSSNQLQFLSMEARLGVRVMRAPDAPEGGADVEAMSELIRRERPRLVSVTEVPTNSGLVQDVRSIGQVCREEEVLFIVDACQSVGQMPVDVADIQCDFLTATSRKFLRGPRGSGFLYASDRVLERGLAPLFIDTKGAEWTESDRYRLVPDARRFENWEFAWALVLGTGEAARYALEIGLESIRDRVRALAERLRTGLGSLGGIRLLDRGRELCGIVSVEIDGRDPREVVLALRAHGINTSAQLRSFALIDFDDKGVQAALRLSPHYFNTEEEVDRALETIEQMIERP